MSANIPPAILRRREEIRDDIAEVSKRILEAPENISQAETAVIQADQALEDLRSQLELADVDLQEEVAANKELTNDTKRKAALAKLRNESEVYRETAREVRHAEAASKQARIDQRKAENLFRAQQRRLSALQAQVQLYFGGYISE